MIGQVGYRFFAKETNSYYTVIEVLPDGTLKCEQDVSGAWVFVSARELKAHTNQHGHFSGKLGALDMNKPQFKVGDVVVPVEGNTPYRVIESEENSSSSVVKNLETGLSWNLYKSQFKPSSYEKDNGPMTPEQMAQIKAASSATDLPESAFTEKLFEEPGQIDKTLTERGSRYGSFNDLAQISQGLKEAMRATPGWAKLTASQKEALEMVQHKVARMLNGDPTYEDNAVDIVGYATLMMKNMQGDLNI